MANEVATFHLIKSNDLQNGIDVIIKGKWTGRLRRLSKPVEIDKNNGVLMRNTFC